MVQFTIKLSLGQKKQYITMKKAENEKGLNFWSIFKKANYLFTAAFQGKSFFRLGQIFAFWEKSVFYLLTWSANGFF